MNSSRLPITTPAAADVVISPATKSQRAANGRAHMRSRSPQNSLWGVPSWLSSFQSDSSHSLPSSSATYTPVAGVEDDTYGFSPANRVGENNKTENEMCKKTSTTASSAFPGTDSGTRKLGLSALVVLIYFEVSGGPFGIEDIVRAGGPFYAIVGFLLLLVWAVPEALITAELATAMPEASGAVAWVDGAFGPFWAFQKGWLSWLSGVTDNALYPILFLDCLLSLMSRSLTDSSSNNDDSDSSGFSPFRWSFILCTTALLTYLNYRGLDIVGTFAIVVCALTLLPFVVFCVCGMWQVQPERWVQGPVNGFWGVDWRLLLNTFFWNINYWESAAAFSGDVKDPGRTFPLALALAVSMVVISLLLPVLVATGASQRPYTEWRDGSFIDLAAEIVGPWLSYWLMFASAVANIGMFEAEMSSDAWIVAGMADRGILPAVLGTRSCYDTPTYAILMSAVGVIGLGWMSFTEVISMLNLLYCYGQLIEFAAFLHLRWYQPDLPRPYRIPLGFFSCTVMLLPPVIFILIIIYFSSFQAIALSITLALMGYFVHYVLEFARENNWCRFEERADTGARACPSADASDVDSSADDGVSVEATVRPAVC